MILRIMKREVGLRPTDPLPILTMFDTPDQLSLWSLVFRAKK